MKFLRLVLGLVLLFSGILRAHQIDTVEFEFQADADEWRLLGEMDIAYMLPEIRGVPGELPLSRAATMKAGPKEFARIRTETENTLRKILQLKFQGKEIPWTIEFPDFEKQPLELPPDDGDTALLSVRIVAEAIPRAGDLLARWVDDLDSELIVLVEQGVEPRILTAPPGQQMLLLRSSEVPRTSIFQWISMGFRHVLPLGLDHLLFILGLFLLLPKWKPLLGQSLLFTLAHSVTLALAVLGLVNVPGRPVEILIAASIAWIGIENLFARKLGKGRLVLVFVFGLIHGLGFASVLGEKLGSLSGKQLVTPLLGFNVGVEVAQVTVLALAFLVLWPLRRWTQTVQVAGSVVVALAGLWWMFERIFAA